MNNEIDSSKLVSLAISDSGFVFDPVTGHSFTTNEVGIQILEKLKKNMLKDDLIEELCAEYDVSYDEADQDVEDFIANLRNNYLI